MSNIKITETGVSLLIKDYLSQKNNLDFAYNRFPSKENYVAQAKDKLAEYKNRGILCRVLSEQNQNPTSKQAENLELLNQENTVTVTTGHQLNLATGPLYFIYKILHTVRICDDLNQENHGINFVPIYWMATEDHDFEEINHFRTENHLYEFFANSGGAVGRIEVENLSFIAEFEKEFQNTVYGTELLLMMKRAYKAGRTLAEATKILVHELFAAYGLLILDGDHPKLKGVMKNTFKKELLHNELFKSTQNQVKTLSDRYGKVQVNPREINLFYLTETRNRIERHGKIFNIVDTDLVFTEDEMLNELQNFPEKFSPNALLRPVYHETVLPNLAYIGGNAEIMYWLELKNYFEHLELPFPVLIPRSSVLILNEKQISKTGKLGVSVEDLLAPVDAVARKILLENHQLPGILASLENQLKEQFSVLKVKAALTEKTFRNLVEAEETRQLKSFKRMRKRLLRAEKINQKEQLASLNNLYASVHPGNVWQERTWNFSVFYADHGRSWIHQCYNAITPYCSELIIFSI